MKKQTREKMRLHRKARVRAKISGTASCPRLAVFRSLKNISVQVIDDQAGHTLAAASLREIGGKVANTIAGAEEVGKLIASKCAALKIEDVVFDRAGYRYHGRVKALAEGARSGGLLF
ncbi:MAG: 50S ribosomal protein L18 [Candidatus Moranbacteria bacterium]|nr:50S ribosomal protein L18 [Candidatus Moranbacteria bacterium]